MEGQGLGFRVRVLGLGPWPRVDSKVGLGGFGLPLEGFSPLSEDLTALLARV